LHKNHIIQTALYFDIKAYTNILHSFIQWKETARVA